MLDDLIVDVLADLEASLDELTNFENEATNAMTVVDCYELRMILTRTMRDVNKIYQDRSKT